MLHCYNHLHPAAPRGPAVYDPLRHNLRCVPINIFCRKDKQVEFQSCVMLQAAAIIRTRYHHSSQLGTASSLSPSQTLYFLPPDECFSSVSYFHSIFKDCQKYPSQTLAGTDEDIYLKHMENKIVCMLFTYIF